MDNDLDLAGRKLPKVPRPTAQERLRHGRGPGDPAGRRISLILADDQLDALAEDTAVRVKIFHREFGAALILLAEPSISAVIGPATPIRISASAARAQNATANMIAAANHLTTMDPPAGQVSTLRSPRGWRQYGNLPRPCRLRQTPRIALRVSPPSRRFMRRSPASSRS
jgi:hypothetical protein